MTTQMPMMARTSSDMDDEVGSRVEALTRETRLLWGCEPTPLGRTRMEVMRDLAALRLDLEALDRRLRHRTPGVEDERALHDCESQFEELRLHWQGI